MSKVLQGLEPQRVFHYFEEICAIPHGSGNEKAISDYCVAFARSHGLWVRQDEANNVIIRKKASKGYENAPVTMLQGHLDMVCEKNNDVAFDFENEGLKLKVDGDSVSASGQRSVVTTVSQLLTRWRFSKMIRWNIPNWKLFLRRTKKSV